MGGNGPDCVLIEWDGAALVYLYRGGNGLLARSTNRRTLNIIQDQTEITFVLQEIMRAH